MQREIAAEQEHVLSAAGKSRWSEWRPQPPYCQWSARCTTVVYPDDTLKAQCLVDSPRYVIPSGNNDGLGRVVSANQVGDRRIVGIYAGYYEGLSAQLAIVDVVVLPSSDSANLQT